MFDLHICAAKSHYHGICYAAKNVLVLFHLGSELWLGLPALAEPKLCSCPAAAGLAALCLCCPSYSCISKTVLLGQVQHLNCELSGPQIVLSFLLVPKHTLFSLNSPCKSLSYQLLPLMFMRPRKGYLSPLPLKSGLLFWDGIPSGILD